MLTYNLDVSEFVNLFDQYSRSENFSVLGREALYRYFEGLSDDIGEDIQIDIIALCCEWSECKEDELVMVYGYLVDDDEPDVEDILSELENHTAIIQVDHYDFISYLIREF